VLFLSCEEPEGNIRDRIERICKHRGIDPHAIDNLHLHFPDLDVTWLVTTDRAGKVTKTALFAQVEAWIAVHRPRLVVIDSIAAVFDGEAIARRQVRSFLAMLRKVAREYDTAIVLLDHPSVRGMSDGSGTANSVDWRNSVRSMLHLSDPDKDDADVRTLEVKKSNYGKSGEKVKLRWNSLTFGTEAAGVASPARAAAERDVDELFLRLLDKRNAQRRPVHPKSAKGSAPSEFEIDPEASGVTADGFRAAMERLMTAGKITVVESGSPSKRRQHLERVVP
jgi:RecA-family ATPase